MPQVINSQPMEQSEHGNGKQPLAFLDTSAILAYLHGDPAAVQLFSAEADGRIRFAVNPIVLQDLLLAADTDILSKFERIRDHLRVLPVDFAKVEALLPRIKALRNRLSHSNDILVISSAGDCDFLVTKDDSLLNLSITMKPQVITPEALASALEIN